MNVTIAEVKEFLELKKQNKDSGQVMISINNGEITTVTEKSDHNTPSRFRDRVRDMKKKKGKVLIAKKVISTIKGQDNAPEIN